MKLREGVVAPAAEKVVERFGGPASVAKKLGTTYSAVWRWSAPRPQGGGGLIPVERQVQLINLAKVEGVELEPAAFFEGVEVLADDTTRKAIRKRERECKATGRAAA